LQVSLQRGGRVGHDSHEAVEFGIFVDEADEVKDEDVEGGVEQRSEAARVETVVDRRGAKDL
jgi:hypothetical protein